MIQVAGGVVWNPALGIVVVSQPNNTWSLPKGHVEEGESHLGGAIREIKEETGIPMEKLELISKIGTYERARIKRKPEDKDEMRSITLYLFKTTAKVLKPEDPDNPEAKWVSINEVTELLTHPKDKEFFETLVASGKFERLQ